jgi:hypothetical protein
MTRVIVRGVVAMSKHPARRQYGRKGAANVDEGAGKRVNRIRGVTPGAKGGCLCKHPTRKINERLNA